MLLAFSAKSEELDILMLSLTFGNVEVKKYVYNILFDLFHMRGTHALDEIQG